MVKWRSWLSGIPQFEIHTDHQGLQYFQTKQRLNARQARWQQDLAEFDFIIKYKPGSTMHRADALTRKSGNAKEGLEQQFFKDGILAMEAGSNMWLPQALAFELDDAELNPRTAHILALELDFELDKLRQDDIEDGHNNHGDLDAHDELSELDELDGLDVSLWQRDDEGLLIPPEMDANDDGVCPKLEVLRMCYDSGIAGHWGRHRTQELVSRYFWWQGWQEDVATYVAGCQRCQLAKSDRHSKATKLLPMPTGVRPWEEISMDFVGELPESEGFNVILVITDRFTKMRCYIPARDTWTAEDVANVYITEV